MASVTESTPSSASRAEERLVDEQIRRTLRSLKLLDLMAGIITLVIGVLAFLLTAAVLDQWVIPGGWSGTARLVLLGLLLVGVGWYSWRAFWPLMSRSINPAYAAQLIERNTPSLKNSLLNFLLLRTHRRQLSQKVYQAIEHQAAQRLSEVSMDTVVDRSVLLRLGYVLVAVVALCALYRVLSPKNLTTSISRVLMPWSEIAVPSRVEILDVTPGETSLARGEPLPISAEVLGLNEDEPVEVHYSTLDGQAEDRVIAMSPAAGGLRYEGKIPDRFSSGDGGGVQQDLDYWITAGDARSSKYRATVFARPTIVVERIRYEFPAYTGLASREVEGTGDIHALEGTKVILHAQANQEIASAHVDFAADGRHDLTMKSQGEKASADFTLELKEDRRTPKYESYVLRYKTESGRTNNLPPKYEIDVTPDYAPEIQILAPRDEEGQLVEQLDVPVNQQFTVEIEARDPDFLLSKVSLLGQLEGKKMLDHGLLQADHEGRFVGSFTATPEELELKPGDIMEYWATASDNRRPQANVAETERLKIRVVGPPQFDQQNQNGEGQEQGQGGGEGEQGEGGESGDEQGEASGAGGESGEEGEQGEGGEGAEGEGGEGQGEQQLGGEGGGGENQESEGGSGDQQENQEGGGGENSEQSEQQQPGDVSAEGDDDGEAFDRISDHFAEEDANSQDQQGGQPQEGESQEGQEGEAETQPGGEGSEGTPDSDQTGDASDSADAEESDSQQGESGSEGAEQDRESQGAGADGDPAGEEQSEQPMETQQSDKEQEAPTGEMSGEQGDPGAGENPGEEQGSPDAIEKKPNDKPGEDSQDPQENDQEAPGQGRGNKESDSQGGQGGDRSGGGQEGAGQQADSEGTGAAGENTAADDGAGQAAEPGAGEDSARPGTDGASDKPTGESAEDQSGEGSKESAEASGSEPGGEEGQTAAGEESQDPGNEASGSEGKPEMSDQANPSNTAGQQPPGGGTGGSSSPPPAGELQPGDEANLEFARQQSDLVLDRLEDQLGKDNVDQELLDKLGWSKEDLKKFVDRWKGLINAAEQEGPEGDEAQQKLNDALLSLGLRPGHRGYQSQAIQDKLRELKDSYRGQTPIEYADQVRAYIKGTATSGEKD
ncbi:putative sodium/potassium/calcium exchanger [Bythopirellula goksoeyrii]|uniref:Immunoglobulin G-binding protein A n=1 Tax=Bythopirellula goksoeyrii TaxID=1400387 RepID=A0A5B9QDX7_9BACT|nr:hypothetical protein [Bythopirellula goksoeyrii]QEG37114.1 hypothetical protein Pr1d_44540 [Bythopirellula goksoeyrii]